MIPNPTTEKNSKTMKIFKCLAYFIQNIINLKTIYYTHGPFREIK
jgi:hypothetical protein